METSVRDKLYRWLLGGNERPPCDQFDSHILACAFSLALDETLEGQPLHATLGLDRAELVAMTDKLFPHARELVDSLSATRELGAPCAPDAGAIARSEDERCIRELLIRLGTMGTDLETWLAGIIARRALQPRHLWEDLGLRNRSELNWLIERHFERVAAKNTRNMRWKKFLYRTICRDEGMGICLAPTCEECDDRDECFGSDGANTTAGSSLQTDVANPTKASSLNAFVCAASGDHE